MEAQAKFRLKAISGIALGMLLITMLLWLGIYAHENIIIAAPVPAPAPAPVEPHMTAFLVAQPNLVVNGAAMERVEMWAVPTGEGVTEAGHRLLGVASLHAGSVTSTQIWALPIPAQPILAAEIFARGFDADGRLVEQMSLPYTGSSQIHDALWEMPPVAPTSSPVAERDFAFTLGVGESFTAGGLTVKLVQIENDSRCPQKAICVWAGEVDARVHLVSESRNQTVSLSSTGPGYSFGGYSIQMSEVSPARSAGLPVRSEYQITFSVQRL